MPLWKTSDLEVVNCNYAHALTPQTSWPIAPNEMSDVVPVAQGLLYEKLGRVATARKKIGRSRVIRNGADTQDTLSFESCMSSVACDMEEVSSEFWRKVQDKEETTSETSWTAVAKRTEKDGWSGTKASP